jgi:hypothetical protein
MESELVLTGDRDEEEEVVDGIVDEVVLVSMDDEVDRDTDEFVEFGSEAHPSNNKSVKGINKI